MSARGSPESAGTREVRLLAPCKLNLFLEVLAKRRDGYHELITLMVAVSLYDTLIVRPQPAGTNRLHCCWSAGRRAVRGAGWDPATGVWDDLPQDQENLVYQTVEALCRAAPGAQGWEIWLWKRIPTRAGLGGASSDAAAVLKACTRIGPRVDAEQLAAIAGTLGSDVPFFLNVGAAVGEGRGERIYPVRPVPHYHFVVTRPPVGLSTAEVYRNCRLPSKPRDVSATLEAFGSGDPVRLGRTLFNRLQEAAREINPWVNRMEKLFAASGCLGYQMTGSGSSFFGLCRHARHARRVAAWLRAMRAGAVYHVTTLALESLGASEPAEGDCHGNHRGSHQAYGEHG